MLVSRRDRCRVCGNLVDLRSCVFACSAAASSRDRVAATVLVSWRDRCRARRYIVDVCACMFTCSAATSSRANVRIKRSSSRSFATCLRSSSSSRARIVSMQYWPYALFKPTSHVGGSVGRSRSGCACGGNSVVPERFCGLSSNSASLRWVLSPIGLAGSAASSRCLSCDNNAIALAKIAPTPHGESRDWC